jgi:hypothetical protein
MVAVGEDFVDLVNGFLAVSRRTPGAERRLELHVKCEIRGGLPPFLQAHEAPGLAGKVVKG